MADDFESGFAYNGNWSDTENILWQDAFGSEFNDPVAQAMYHSAYFEPGTWDSSQVSAIREALADYLSDTYDLEFDEVFDWEAWRESYGNAA